MRIQNQQARSAKRGSALVLSMMFVVIVAGMGVCMVQLHSSQNKRKEQAIDNKRAIYIAEAGLAESFFCLCKGQSGQIGTDVLPATHGGGLYWVDATMIDENRVALVSTGLIGIGRFSLAAVLQRNTDPVASLGFFAGTDLTMASGAIVDGYDSTKGTFASQVSRGSESTEDFALIGAAGDITLAGDGGRGGGTQIYGDAYPGASGVVTIGVGATVSGSTAPRASNPALPAIEVPEVTTREAAVAEGKVIGGLDLGDADTSETGKYGMAILEVAANESHTITGPAVVVLEQLVLGNNSTLELDTTDGAVVIYVTDRIKAPSTSQFDNLQDDPNSFALLVSATVWEDFDGDLIADNPVEFEPQGEFYGYLYAPDSDVTIGSNLHFIGGLAANNVTVSAGAHLTFDQCLVTSDLAVAGLPKLVAWHPCEVPDVPITARDTTPTKYLDDNLITPVVSSVASSDTYVKLRYYDLNGDTQSYSGLASTFGWTKVSEVTAIVWDDDAVVGDEGQVETKPSTMSTATKVDREVSGKERL